MISTLELKNFQSHKQSLLEFHSGMNVIIGKSDTGKSAIIRALRLVTENKPNGDSYRSHWGGDTEVSISKNNETLSRIRKNTQNGYVLNGTEHNAIGQDVPEEILKWINFTEVNLQSQMDAPFLLSETSGKVAQYFNKVAGLEQIDASIKYITSVHKKAKSENEMLEKYIKGINTDISALPDINTFEKSVTRLARMQSRIEKLIQQRIAITTIVTDLQVIENKKIPVEILKAKEIQLQKLINLSSRISIETATVNSLQRITNSYKRNIKELEAIKQKTKGLKTVEKALQLSVEIRKNEKAHKQIERIIQVNEKNTKQEKECTQVIVYDKTVNNCIGIYTDAVKRHREQKALSVLMRTYSKNTELVKRVKGNIKKS